MKQKTHKISWTDEKVNLLWDFYSNNPHYKKTYFSYQAGTQIIDYIDQFIGLKKVKTILDYGCGAGHLLKALLPMTKPTNQIICADTSEKSIEKIKEQFSHHPQINKTYILGKENNEIPNNIADLVICLEVVEHLNDFNLEKVVTEAYRILKKGGFFFVSTPNSEDLDAAMRLCPDCGCIFHQWQHMRSWTTETLSSYMSEKNFNTYHIRATNVFSSRFERRFPKLFPNRFKNTPNLIYIGKK